MALSPARDTERRSPSPAKDDSPVIKRAARTYGRARPAAADNARALASTAAKAASPEPLRERAPLSTILRARPSHSDIASDDDEDDEADNDAVPTKFAWDWQKQLKAFSDDDDDEGVDELPGAALPKRQPHDALAAHDTPDVSLDASDLPSSAKTLIERSPAKQTIDSSQSSLGDSPIPRHKSKPRRAIVANSDDDEEPAPRKPAMPLSAFRGTPSDSDDELPSTVTISPRRKPSSAGKPSVPLAKDDAKTKPATRRTTAAQSGKGKPKVKACDLFHTE
ncbi:hypothetical protein EV715DRAFT_208878 [Schizophyllum commune]